MKNIPELHWRQLLITLPLLIAIAGCGDSTTDAAKTATPSPGDPVAVQARPEATNPGAAATEPKVNVPALNQALVSKMTFAEPKALVTLIQQGATPEAKNRYGLPVIFMAAERGEPTVLEALIKAGADVNSTIATSFNDDGAGYTGTVDGTVLCYAARKGKIAAMALLKEAGADLNGTGPAGTSPLMSAAENLQLEAVQWLLNNGSTAGKAKALGLAQQFLNPDEKTQQIIQLLK